MRMPRTLSGLLATVLLGLGAVGPAWSTGASEAGIAEPEREVSSHVVETKRNQLILKGNVNPGHAQKPVLIQKRNCLESSCSWFQFDKVRTNDDGGFRSRVTAPRHGSDYWRAKVKAHGGYATSHSRVWRTYTT